MSKNKRNKPVSLDTYLKNVKNKSYASVIASFEHSQEQSVAFLVNTMVRNENIEPLTDPEHPKHRLFVRDLYQVAFDRCGVEPVCGHSFAYQVQVINGKTHNVEGVIAQEMGTLFFDRWNTPEKGKNELIANGEIALRGDR